MFAESPEKEIFDSEIKVVKQQSKPLDQSQQPSGLTDPDFFRSLESEICKVKENPFQDMNEPF